MRTAPAVSVDGDLRLWATAVAAFAIVLQSLLLGFVGSDEAMARPMDHASMAMADRMAQGSHNDRQPSSCALCCVSCTAAPAMGTPTLPPTLAPGLVNAIALR